MDSESAEERADRLAQEADGLAPWQYRYELAPGVFTPNSDEHHEWNRLRRRLIVGALSAALGPGGFRGRSFLDGGCNAGLWSFELHRLGATDIDSFDARPENIEKCEFIRSAKGIPAEELRFQEANLYDMEKRFGPHDVVLALGYMYHLSDPIEIARQLGAVTRDLCVVDSNVNTQPGSVCVYRSEDPELHHNAVETSVIVPNQNALIEMLRAGGFGIVTQVQPPAWAPVMYRDGRRILLLAYKSDGPSSDCDAF
jgi:SAM-dependent methyltransferase